MAIKRIRDLPNELPHALIYLDDVDEIRNLLTEAYANAVEARRKEMKSDRKTEIKVVYEVDDLKMDSVEDLIEYGSSAKNFKLEVISDDSTHAEFVMHSFFEPRLRLSWPLQDDVRWAVYGQVKAILERRQLRFKNAILDWPEWLKISSYLLTTIVFGYVPLATHGLVRVCLFVVWAMLLTMILYVAFRPSRVFFVRSHERSKLSATARQGYIKAIALLFIGGVVGKLIDLLFAHFKTK